MNHKKDQFKVIGKYSENGVDIAISNSAIRLNSEDVSYLLLGVDGHATANADYPPAEVGFMLYGRLHVMANEDWASFQEALSSAADEGGWLPC